MKPWELYAAKRSAVEHAPQATTEGGFVETSRVPQDITPWERFQQNRAEVRDELESRKQQIAESEVELQALFDAEQAQEPSGEQGKPWTLFGGQSPVQELSGAVVTPAIQAVAAGLQRKEGIGDLITDVPTGPIGVTPAALKAVGMSDVDPEDLSVEEAEDIATRYLTQLDSGFRKNLEGYEGFSDEAKQAILDAGYNLGPKIANFPSFKRAVKNGDEQEALRQLLDTANEGNKTLRGLARRRAENYNLVADNPITTIEQLEDGTLNYLDSDGNIIFSYKTSGGRHEDSAVGSISVN